MNQHISAYIMSAIELPPVNEAERKARAARETNCEAFLDAYTMPANFDHEALDQLIGRIDLLAAAFDRFIVEAAVTGKLDRARFRELQAEQGRLREALLTLLGADPESDDLMERQVELVNC